MEISGLLGQKGRFMSNLLDLRQKRQEIIAANIANVETPGYKSRTLDFEQVMGETLPMPGELPMMRTDSRHLPVALAQAEQGDIQAVEIPIPKGDKNSVDLEQEMAKQSANQVLYNYAVQSMSGQLSNLRTMIDNT